MLTSDGLRRFVVQRSLGQPCWRPTGSARWRPAEVARSWPSRHAARSLRGASGPSRTHPQPALLRAWSPALGCAFWGTFASAVAGTYRSLWTLVVRRSTSTNVPFGAQRHGAAARRSGADDLCSRSGAFRVFAECARSADLARQAWWRDVALLTIASALDRHIGDDAVRQPIGPRAHIRVGSDPEGEPSGARPVDTRRSDEFEKLCQVVTAAWSAGVYFMSGTARRVRGAHGARVSAARTRCDDHRR